MEDKDYSEQLNNSLKEPVIESNRELSNLEQYYKDSYNSMQSLRETLINILNIKQSFEIINSLKQLENNLKKIADSIKSVKGFNDYFQDLYKPKPYISPAPKIWEQKNKRYMLKKARK